MEVYNKILIYLGLRKPDPDSPTNASLKVMHGINKISIVVFLVALVLMVIKLVG